MCSSEPCADCDPNATAGCQPLGLWCRQLPAHHPTCWCCYDARLRNSQKQRSIPQREWLNGVCTSHIPKNIDHGNKIQHALLSSIESVDEPDEIPKIYLPLFKHISVTMCDKYFKHALSIPSNLYTNQHFFYSILFYTHAPKQTYVKKVAEGNTIKSSC